MSRLSPAECFEELRSSFLNHRNDNDAKAKEFRTTLERFFNSVVESPKYLALAAAQELWYQSSGNYQLNRIVSSLRIKLNDVVHGHRTGISDETLLIYFKMCIQIVCLVSGEDPDELTKSAYGVFDESYLNALNEQQRAAVLDPARIVYVNAGPGTGKTHLLVYKMLDIMHKVGSDARIVSMSYTRSSAESLSVKLEKTVAGVNFRCPVIPYAGTIHSFCLNSIKAYKKSIGQKFDYIIADESEIDDMAEEIYHACDGRQEIESIRSFLKNPESIDDLALKTELEDKKRMYRRLSVSEILTLYLSELTGNDKFAEWEGRNMNYLLVDEAQDLTVQNYQIFDVLLSKIPNLKLFLVGDPRQNIFSFLGGSYRHLEHFLSKYESQSSSKNLSITYRCPSRMLEYTNGMKFSDCENIALESRSSESGVITVKSYDDEYEEARAVVEYVAGHPDHNNIAIIASTLKPLSHIVDILNENGVPFVIQGGKRIVKPHINAFYYLNKLSETNMKSYAAAKFLCGYFGISGNNQESFLRSDIGKSFVKLHEKYSSKAISYISFARELFKLCVAGLPQDADLPSVHADFRVLGDAVIVKSSSSENFTKTFQNFRKQFSSLETEFKSTSSGVPVTITTIHSAKGLEWDYVLMPCMSDRFFPNPKYTDGLQQDAQQDLLNDELKKMFVAATRAKKELFITYPTTLRDMGGVYASPSRFLMDMIF